MKSSAPVPNEVGIRTLHGSQWLRICSISNECCVADFRWDPSYYLLLNKRHICKVLSVLRCCCQANQLSPVALEPLNGMPCGTLDHLFYVVYGLEELFS